MPVTKEVGATFVGVALFQGAQPNPQFSAASWVSNDPTIATVSETDANDATGVAVAPGVVDIVVTVTNIDGTIVEGRDTLTVVAPANPVTAVSVSLS